MPCWVSVDIKSYLDGHKVYDAQSRNGYIG